MVTNLKSAMPAAVHLSGAKNGNVIGTMFAGVATPVDPRVNNLPLKDYYPTHNQESQNQNSDSGNFGKNG